MATPSTIARGRNVVHGLQHQTQQPWTNTHAAASQFAASPRCVSGSRARPTRAGGCSKQKGHAAAPQLQAVQRPAQAPSTAACLHCQLPWLSSCCGLACRHNCKSHACRLTLITGCWRSCRPHQYSCCCAPDRAVRRQGQRCYQREIDVRHTPAAAAAPAAPATCI